MQNFMFDFDGTLINTEPVFIQCVQDVLKKNGLPPKTSEEIHPFLGLADFHVFEDLLGVRGAEDERLRGQMHEYYQKYASALEAPFEGILPWLEMLKEDGAQLFVCSVRPPDNSLPSLERLGITKYLTDIWGNDEGSGRDTKAKVLCHELNKAKLDPTQCVMIGDKDFDCMAAHAAGTFMLGCSYGYGTAEELHHFGSDVIVSSVKQGQQATRVLRRM